jgi:undecaprenyl-diphosphatase
VRSLRVVLDPPLLDQNLRLFQRVKDLSIQALVSQFPVDSQYPFSHGLPRFDPALHFQWPYNVDADQFIRWCSFPSDHAALFAALAMGIFFRSRRAGAAMFAYVVLVTFVPRIYMGYHWPSDILAGSVMGILVAYIALIPSVRRWSKQLYEQCNKHSGLFTASLFLLTYEIGTLFNGPRLLLTSVASLLKRWGS